MKEEDEKQIRSPPEGPVDEIREEELAGLVLQEVPTFLRITNARDPIGVEKGGNALIRLETDAKDGYLADTWGEHFRCLHTKGMTSRKSESNLRKGKVSYFVLCPSAIRVGTREILRFELDRPGMSPLVAERAVECVPPHDRKKEKSRKQLPEPNIVPVSESENRPVWNQFSWNDRSVGRVITEEDPGIYVSVDNKHLKRA